MSQDDPFASSDLDKTIILPSPGGRPTFSNQKSISRSSVPNNNGNNFDEEELSKIIGLNPLIEAANPLLNSVIQLRLSSDHSNLSGLQQDLAQRIKVFEENARANGIAHEKIIAARYALCTLIDEAIASTPWGSGKWGEYSLLVMFHNEVFGGEKFFQLLTKLLENTKANKELLELMYICITLGFEGRYRVIANGKIQLGALREKLAQSLIKERNLYERDLSPHWHPSPYKSRKFFLAIPIWVFLSFCGLTLLTTYFSLNFSLNTKSDPVFSEIQSIQTQSSIPKPTIINTTAKKNLLADFLYKEIQEGLITLQQDNEHSVITLLGDGMFSPGSTAISHNYVAILNKIAEALSSAKGQIQIVGHTDNRPIFSTRFSSNWSLSNERARSAMQILSNQGISMNRLSVEGRADTKPIASNDTAEGRARNRRIEIIIMNSL